MLNLNSTINLDFKSFFRWWGRELAFLVPEKLQQLLNETKGYLIVRPEKDVLVLGYQQAGKYEELAKFMPNDIGRESFKALKSSDERLQKATVVLRLTQQQALAKVLCLPLAAKENLNQVIAYELDRYTPFKPEQVYFTVKPLGQDQELGQLRVLLVLTPKQQFNTSYQQLKTVGLVPTICDYASAANALGQADDSYNLLPEALQKNKTLAKKLQEGGLLAITGLLLLVSITLPVWFEYQAVTALEEKVEVLGKEAKKIEALQAEIDVAISQAKQLVDEKNAAPDIIAMLDTLSGQIKDDTWLTFAQYSDRHWQIQGESPAASALIGILEATDMFANARFASPVTQDKSTELERFQITFDIASVDTNPSSGGNIGKP
ncbi:MAG: PilN domain-containing protein [Methylococcaceae bacterium]|jgi:general secretion pathway protein L